MKIARLLEAVGLTLLAAATAVPALASEPPPPVAVPEPGTLGLLTVGIGGAWLVSKYLRRK